MVVLEVGRKDTQTTGQISNPLSQGQGRGALALTLGVSWLTLQLGTQPVHTGALFSVDPSRDSRVLGCFLSYQKTGGI